jgi:four helix bundle protein
MLDAEKAIRSCDSGAMKARTRAFAKDAVLACRKIAPTQEGRYVASQLFRSSTSVAANYRAACRARSKKEFIAKIGIVLEEADETLFWLEFSQDIGVLAADLIAEICDEANQLIAILSATQRTARKKL